jgi:hypothetical protein
MVKGMTCCVLLMVVSRNCSVMRRLEVTGFIIESVGVGVHRLHCDREGNALVFCK